MGIVLASQSPYRKQLLKQLAVDFETCASHIDEDSFKNKISNALELTQVLAFEKAKKVSLERPDDLVIGSDQAIIFKGEILGKPKTAENACKQLELLQGASHKLISAVCLLGPNGIKREFYHETTLTMRELSPAQIFNYVEKDQPLECAGSYMIEKLGITLFESINSTDSTSIIGLPLIQLTTHLKELGLFPLDQNP
tara:strand:- start:214885 stop:215475 length:591 start_codon:yes stop_codon:yes gene_type:complete